MVLIITTQSVFAQTNKRINPLIGKWETPNRPDQKTITTMNITAYGKIEYNISVPLSGSFIAFGNTLVSIYNSILVDLIIKTFNGNYDIKGDEIIINFFNSRPLRIKYSITNDVLSIQNEGTNKQLKLNRIVK